MIVAHDFDELLNVLFGHLSGCVKPDEFDGAVLAGDFFDLWQAFFDKIIVEGGRVAIGICAWAVCPTRKSPVLIVRVVESKSETEFFAGPGEFFHGVAIKLGDCTNVKVVAG